MFQQELKVINGTVCDGKKMVFFVFSALQSLYIPSVELHAQPSPDCSAVPVEPCPRNPQQNEGLSHILIMHY
jgi:hypothetical protein